MDTDCFVRDEVRALRKTRQSMALRNLRQSVAGNIQSFRISNSADDEVDDLVLSVLKTMDDQAEAEESIRQSTILPSRRTTDPRVSQSILANQKRARRLEYFWVYFLAVPIIFTHGVATRMQFMYGGLYGRDGLNLSNALAILAVGFTAMGRATAPPLLSRFFKHPYLFMFLNATTLIGCSGMFLIPIIGGSDNFDSEGLLKEGKTTGVGTILFFYFTMYVQGLAEVLSGWDLLMKFEMRTWTPEQQQLAFRVSFVSIALGSATAFASSSWLFEYFGLYGVTYLGLSAGVFNVIFPAIYLSCRWKPFCNFRKGGNKQRSKASRRSQPLMRMLDLDDLDEEEDSSLFLSTRKLKFVEESERRSKLKSSTFTNSGHFSVTPSQVRPSVDYLEPRNYFEFQEQLQHQTADRLMVNFQKLKREATGFVKDQMSKIKNADILAAFDPTLLLTHSEHIHWPKGFFTQIMVMRLFCILALALGSMMISSQFAVYVLYLVDVWGVSSVFAGTSMALGEISGMLTLLLSIYLEKRQAEKLKGEEDSPATKKDSLVIAAPAHEKQKVISKEVGTWRTLLHSPTLLLQVPSMFVVCCFLAVIPLALLGFVRPKEGDLEGELAGIATWPKGLIVALSSGILVGIVNCVMHATTVEMAAMLLPEDLFGSALAWGYSLRRITNLVVCLSATLLYSASNFAVYQTIAGIYLLTVPLSVYVLAVYIKCMPWQKRDVVFETHLGDNEIACDSNKVFADTTLGLDAFDEESDEESESEKVVVEAIPEEKSSELDVESVRTSSSSEEKADVKFGSSDAFSEKEPTVQYFVNLESRNSGEKSPSS